MPAKDKKRKVTDAELKKKGINVVMEVERSHFVDQDGELREDDMLYAKDNSYFENGCLQKMANVLIWMRCLSSDPKEVLSIKSWLCWLQWLALLCDLTAAIVAVVTFSDVTYCCGKPVLNIAGSIPWKTVIRIGTYVYLLCIFAEIYPVVRKGFPFNIVNPMIGFIITFAMFFDDSMAEALTMWGIETAAIICEFVLYRLKVRQLRKHEKELVEVGRKTKEMRELEEGEDPDAPQQELTETRQKYAQLKADESIGDSRLLCYLGTGCFVNITLSLIVLALIIVIWAAEGLCISNFNFPRPWELDQLGQCSLCSNTTGVCEICTEEAKQCYYPYS